jgi:hypothetical protein
MLTNKQRETIAEMLKAKVYRIRFKDGCSGKYLALCEDMNGKYIGCYPPKTMMKLIEKAGTGFFKKDEETKEGKCYFPKDTWILIR